MKFILIDILEQRKIEPFAEIFFGIFFWISQQQKKLTEWKPTKEKTTKFYVFVLFILFDVIRRQCQTLCSQFQICRQKQKERKYLEVKLIYNSAAQLLCSIRLLNRLLWNVSLNNLSLWLSFLWISDRDGLGRLCRWCWSVALQITLNLCLETFWIFRFWFFKIELCLKKPNSKQYEQMNDFSPKFSICQRFF